MILDIVGEADVDVGILNIQRKAKSLAHQSFQAIEGPPYTFPHGYLVWVEILIPPRAPVQAEMVGHPDDNTAYSGGHVEFEHAYQEELDAESGLDVLQRRWSP